MVRVIGPHRIDQADVVDHLRRVRKRIGHPHARLTMPLDGILSTHHYPDIGNACVANLFDATWIRLAIQFGQFRFGIKQVHLARAAVHE